MKFKLKGQSTISIYTEVEAETLEEAIEIAENRDLRQISPDRFYTEEEYWCCDELDVMVKNIEESID